MKRLFAAIIVIAVVVGGCCAVCLRSPELASTAAEVLPAPVVERLSPLYHKLQGLLPESVGAGAADAGDSGEADEAGRSGGWSLPSLGDIGISSGTLGSAADVVLVPTDDYGQNYVFEYGSEQFAAYFDGNSWKVYDSYRITNHDDIVKICQALQNEHVVYGSDWETPRTADDMAFEWEQHNLAYRMLPEDNHWREDAKDVDLDPYDQGKTLDEMYESRTGQKLDLRNYL